MLLRQFNHYLEHLLHEDDALNDFYSYQLPTTNVECALKFKSPQIVAGMPFFFQVFNRLLEEDSGRGHDFFSSSVWSDLEGKELLEISNNKPYEITFNLPFNVMITGERLALNILQRCSSIASYTNLFVQKAKTKNISILDTRKTTPGLRFLEKYAVRVGQGHNHRFNQSEMFMIKDNHKKYFGGLEHAYLYFQKMNSFYTPILAEIHDMSEFECASKLGIKHVMLDNFNSQQIHEVLKNKPTGMTIEVSGGISLDNLDHYLIEGIDAISIGRITYGAPSVDISLKINRKL